MNLSFGAVGLPDDHPSDAVIGRLRRLFGAEARPLAEGAVLHGVLDDGGAVLGTARDGEISLSYQGLVWKSAPGWKQGTTPLDEPDQTAAYLLDRFRRYDVAFLDGLTGHFSVTVVDSRARRVVLGCDGFGMRRLFVHEQDGVLRFASKLAAMVALLGDQAELDRSLEDFLLGFEFLPWGRTPFAGVQILDAGTLLDWRPGAREERPIEKSDAYARRWADVELGAGDAQRAADLLHEGLQETLDDQLPAAGKVGVLLGGFDSALVTAMLVERGKEVETFSFHFEKQRFNQPLVDETTRALGVRHHWVEITPQILLRGLESFATRFHQPASQPHYLIQTAEVCAAMRRRGIEHAFSGDGCDGLFLGYPTVYRRARLIDRLSRVPKPLVRLALAVSALPPLEPLLGHPYRLGRNVLRILLRDMPERAHIASRIFDELSLSRLRLSPPPAQEKDVEAILKELARGLESMNPVRLAYHGKGAVGLNKSKLEGCSDATGVIIQSPYVHPGLAALAAKIPDELLRPPASAGAARQAAGKGKYALMRMAEERGLLAPDVIYQAKRSPVHAPVDSWYQDELREATLGLMDALPFRWSRRYVESLLRPKLAEDLYRRHISLGDLALHSVALLASFSRFSALPKEVLADQPAAD